MCIHDLLVKGCCLFINVHPIACSVTVCTYIRIDQRGSKTTQRAGQQFLCVWFSLKTAHTHTHITYNLPIDVTKLS